MQTVQQKRRSTQPVATIDVAGFLSIMVIVPCIAMAPYAVVVDRHGETGPPLVGYFRRTLVSNTRVVRDVITEFRAAGIKKVAFIAWERKPRN